MELIIYTETTGDWTSWWAGARVPGFLWKTGVWSVLIPVSGHIPSPLPLHPWLGDSSERWREVPFSNTESISWMTRGFSKDKAAASFMPTPSLGDLSHSLEVCKLQSNPRTCHMGKPVKASFWKTTNARKTCFLWQACPMRRKWGPTAKFCVQRRVGFSGKPAPVSAAKVYAD